MVKEFCEKEHRFYDEFLELPISQDNQSGDRHICAGCAYVEGMKDAINKNTRQTDLSHLPESQAGAVRHKGAIEAYNMGYNHVERMSK